MHAGEDPLNALRIKPRRKGPAGLAEHVVRLVYSFPPRRVV
jgi:hypothetical protein